MSEHVLFVPMDGPFELLHSDMPIDLRRTLEERGNGTYVHFEIRVDNEPGGTMAFLAESDQAEENERAREILVYLTGVHMRLTGNVVFHQVDPALVVEIARKFG